MSNKLRECFDEMVVYKDLQKTNFFSSLSLPSFLRDWILKKFEDDEGNYSTEEISDFIRTYYPRKEEWVSIKDRLITDNEHDNPDNPQTIGVISPFRAQVEQLKISLGKV
jgi:ATP-dependent Lon protease